jgi:hypothetical protein
VQIEAVDGAVAKKGHGGGASGRDKLRNFAAEVIEARKELDHKIVPLA